MFFKSRQKELEEKLEAYRECAKQCVELGRDSLRRFCEKQDFDRLHEDMVAVHEVESDADDLRREIENMMYARALFPESRGDILGLLETMDAVPNEAQHMIGLIINQRITIPEKLHTEILELMDFSHQCALAMFEASRQVFTDFTSATATTGKIDRLETSADDLQIKLVRTIFASDWPGLDKLLLRDLVLSVSRISDQAERVGDRIRIMVVKRLV